MEPNPHEVVLLSIPASHAGLLLKQQGIEVPLTEIIRRPDGAAIGCRLAAPFADVVLIHGDPITPALRARMRAALDHWRA